MILFKSWPGYLQDLAWSFIIARSKVKVRNWIEARPGYLWIDPRRTKTRMAWFLLFREQSLLEQSLVRIYRQTRRTHCRLRCNFNKDCNITSNQYLKSVHHSCFPTLFFSFLLCVLRSSNPNSYPFFLSSFRKSTLRYSPTVLILGSIISWHWSTCNAVVQGYKSAEED